ncbi:MAG: FAD-binding protein [Acidobacteriota bacterium]|nr:FAD-binding protein [Acidobacteriota bacterium]
MNLVSVSAMAPVPQANAALVDVNALRRSLEAQIEGEVRFDEVSRALYSTDASVYQIRPLGVVVVRSREDVIRVVRLCHDFHCPLTMRGGGTSQAGQAIGAGLQVDTSKYFNRILDLNVEQRWVRVEPGIVLDELNAHLRPHNLRFAPDISTASRATVGGMMANNSSGARSVLYGKTIDHVLEQHVVLADGTVAHLRALNGAELENLLAADTLEGECYRVVRRLALEHAAEVERRYPKVMRRVQGYNLDAFVDPGRPFDLTKMMVGSEGTLGVVLEAKLNLVPLPTAKSVLAIQFRELQEALEAAPLILRHKPSAVEVMDRFILNHTSQSAALQRLRDSFIEGDPGALLCVEFYDETQEALAQRMKALEEELRFLSLGYRYFHAVDPAAQARVWSLREAALGLSMSMKEDSKSISFVEDTAVAPEKLRDYIDRFLQVVRKHNTSAGVYAHASVGCLHVRPVVNLKTADGIRKFESLATEVADLVLEFGGALSGEHGDGLVRSPFLRKMFGPVIYEAFRTIKRTFDPHGILNPGKIVDPPPLTDNLRYGTNYQTSNPATYFDYSDYNGMSGAVEMCSGLGACRKKLDGTMCPSYMATLEEQHTTRGRANVLRLAMSGQLGDRPEQHIYETLDLCLECRACKAECPVGVDMARFKSEFLASYWEEHGTPAAVRMLANAHAVARWGSAVAGLANWAASTGLARTANERLLGIDSRRTLPRWAGRTLESRVSGRDHASPEVLLFNDTFTNYYEPEIGVAAWDLLESSGARVGLAPNVCCGRPLISKGLLKKAREQARRNTELLKTAAARDQKIVFCEPSCLSAVREDAPSLLRGDEQKAALAVARASVLFEEYLDSSTLPLRKGPPRILLHGHCHQKAMGLLPAAKTLLTNIPGSTVVDLDAGCCGMAGSFGYAKKHFEVSRLIAERRLLPLVRAKAEDDVVVAPGTSCRHQIADFANVKAVHPAVLLRSLLFAG